MFRITQKNDQQCPQPIFKHSFKNIQISKLFKLIYGNYENFFETVGISKLFKQIYGNFKNFYEGNRVAQKAKGGVIRQPVAQNRRLAKGGTVKKSRTRKKSIDGIARRGHTRAPHK